jgi:hypothetical protein
MASTRTTDSASGTAGMIAVLKRVSLYLIAKYGEQLEIVYGQGSRV